MTDRELLQAIATIHGASQGEFMGKPVAKCDECSKSSFTQWPCRTYKLATVPTHESLVLVDKAWEQANRP